MNEKGAKLRFQVAIAGSSSSWVHRCSRSLIDMVSQTYSPQDRHSLVITLPDLRLGDLRVFGLLATPAVPAICHPTSQYPPPPENDARDTPRLPSFFPSTKFAAICAFHDEILCWQVRLAGSRLENRIHVGKCCLHDSFNMYRLKRFNGERSFVRWRSRLFTVRLLSFRG